MSKTAYSAQGEAEPAREIETGESETRKMGLTEKDLVLFLAAAGAMVCLFPMSREATTALKLRSKQMPHLKQQSFKGISTANPPLSACDKLTHHTH